MLMQESNLLAYIIPKVAIPSSKIKNAMQN
jgi:hypothetical protein